MLKTDYVLFWDYMEGWKYWHHLKRIYHIDYSKVVLVLSGDNTVLDEECIKNLWKFARRKYVKEAFIFCRNDDDKEIHSFLTGDEITHEIIKISKQQMDLLYRYYSFHKFFENIVFTYTDTPKGNLLGRFFRETDVNEYDAACLALYHLRSVE